jgi:putative ABC transport system permease protein
MKLNDTLEETFSALLSNKVRTSLTMLGIIIGIASVIVMVSVGQGASSSITERIESSGSNLLMITPGATKSIGYGARSATGTAQTLTINDSKEILASIDSVKNLTNEVSGRYQVVYKGNNTNTSVMGTDANYSSVRNVSILQGNFIENSYVESSSKIAVLGPSVVEDLFALDEEEFEDIDLTNIIGKTIKINKIEFKIVGVTKEKGSSGFSNQDSIIYVPYTTAQKYLSGNKYLTEIDVQISDSNLMTEAQTEITNLLLSLHNISDTTSADFSINNQSDLLETITSTTQTLTILLGAIAGISLLVGGIGIMNMMLTTVTERTKEIGLRKAIGATGDDVSFQFLTEAVVLTFSGGVIGVILGWTISFLINYFNITSTTVSIGSIMLAVGVSAGIGIIFGYYPAKRAARMNPIEALRYE